MKFIDQVNIEIIAGKGGNGVISFRHEHRVEKGGPDGGDGGDGGDIFFQGDSGINTLLTLHILKHIKGHDGENGGSKNMYGAKGKSTIIKVPYGTLVYEGEKLICDVTDSNKYLICKGGIGGRGNAKFKSSRNTVPKISENGTFGERKNVRLELKVMADVGLVGKPSAGKSTLLSLLSKAKPKIANYEFTTLIPQLGLVKVYDNSFVLADLPGLIKGASKGKGMGIQFLKHIERCRVIAFVIDFGDEGKDPIEDYKTIKSELCSYNIKILEKSFLIIANKSDLPSFQKNLTLFKKKFPKLEIVEISAIHKNNIDELKNKMFRLFNDSQDVFLEKKEDEVFVTLDEDFKIEKVYEGMYDVSGKVIENIYNKNPLNTYENILRFNKQVKLIGLWKGLIDAGVQKGDTIRIQGYQFIWEDEK